MVGNLICCPWTSSAGIFSFAFQGFLCVISTGWRNATKLTDKFSPLHSRHVQLSGLLFLLVHLLLGGRSTILFCELPETCSVLKWLPTNSGPLSKNRVSVLVLRIMQEPLTNISGQLE